MKKTTLAASLPGVRRISWLPCGQLPSNVMLTAICGQYTSLFRADIREIPFSGTADFKHDRSILNGVRVEKSTLTFRSSMVLPEGERMAFVVELMNGAGLLIGAREPNYPQVESSFTAGSPSGEAAVRTYKVTHYDVKSALTVVL